MAGLSKNMSINDIANKHKVDVNVLKQELKKGIKVEHEHTSDLKKAARIAMDHLFEDPKYYTKLDKIGLEENKNISYIKPNFEVEWEEATRYPEFEQVGKEGWLKIARNGNTIKYSEIKDYLGNVDLDFKNLEEPKKQRFNKAFEQGRIELPIVVKFDNDSYDLVAGNTRLSGLVKNGIDPTLWVVNIPNVVNESLNQDLIKEFLKACMLELGIINLPKITLSNNSQEAIDMRSWGGYMPGKKAIHIVTAKRHPADIFRTLAHELVHYKQDLEGRLKPESGETGSKDENEANSKAAVIMRNFAQEKPNLFEHLLKEVGDIVNAFPWKYDFVDDDGNFFYTFNTPENKYSVGITYNGGNSYEILFNTAEEMGKDTGENVATRVISTVFEIMLDFINKENPDDLIIRPTEEKRGRIYRHYAEKNIPDGYKLISIGDTQHWIKK
jgi:hypothetical protein